MKAKLRILAICVCVVAMILSVGIISAMAADTDATLIAEGGIETPYGVIPADFTDATAYPIAAFKDGKHIGSYSLFGASSGDNKGALDALGGTNGVLRFKDEDAATVQLYFIGDVVSNGYDNTSYFYRKFKERYGVSPKEFRG